MKGYRIRRNRGSVVLLAFVAMVPLVAAIGGFAADCMHFNDAKSELQRCADAAALAGAEDLNYYKGTLSSTGTTVSNANEEPVNFALMIAKMNAVDGLTGVYTDSSINRSITATILYDSNYGGVANQPNRCNVSSSIYIRSIFAKLFGNFGNTVTASSSAAVAGPGLDTYDLYVPILVSSIDAISGQQLKNMSIGDTLTVQIMAGNGKNQGNAVWVMNPNPIDQQTINYIADPTKYTMPDLPVVSVGDTITSDNGNKGPNANYDQLIGKTVVFPVTDDSTGANKPSHVVIGFVAMKITASDGSNPVKYIQGQIVQGFATGLSLGKTYGSNFSSYPFANGSVIQGVKLVQ